MRNLIADVAMLNLGHTLQAESASGEHLFLTDLTRDSSVSAVFDQPQALTVFIRDSSGRRTRTSYTADFLVIDDVCVTAYEVKPEDVLQDLCRRRPTDWRSDNERYRYLPAIQAFGELGIRHVTVSSAQLNLTRADNFRLLQLARQAPETRGLAKQRHLILKIVQHENAIKAKSVLERLETVDATAILQCLDRGEIFAAVDLVSLSDMGHVWLATAEAAACTLQSGDQSFLQQIRAHGDPVTDWIDAKYESTVAWRLAVIQGETKNTMDGKKALSRRTIRRYKKQYADAGNDPRALQPRWALCGNRESRLTPLHRSFLEQCIRAAKSSPTCPSVHKAHLHYQSLFLAQRELFSAFDSPVKRSTYYVWWNELSHKDADSAKRGGRRLANRDSDSFDPKNRSLVATRPFSIGHIDHWKTDFFVVVYEDASGRKYSVRPWLTAMVDSFTGEVLAIWLSFADPSKKACSMVVRDCVRRHSRLPEIIITDGGSEFRSPHFLVMLASLGVTRMIRPPEDPRFGTEAERLFGSLKSSFAKGLPGYGLSIEECRAVSGSFKSPQQAKLNLLGAYKAVETFTFAGYNKNLKPGVAATRHDIRVEAMKRMPFCGVVIKADVKFLIATAIEAPRETYKLTDGRGLHVNDLWYSNPRLLNYRGFKKDIAVRIEPYDHSVIYACIEGKWLVCHCSLSRLHGMKTDRGGIAAATEFYELKTLRRALRHEADMTTALLVNEIVDRAVAETDQY